MFVSLQRAHVVRVSISEAEVQAFADKWPCFGVVGPLTFEFDSAGNIIDITGDAGMDDTAVVALIEDAAAVAAPFFRVG